jgi:hypothetical protein
VKVGDLVRDKQWPEDPPGLIVSVGDLRTREPYKVLCFWSTKPISFSKKYIQEECEVVSESRQSNKV